MPPLDFPLVRPIRFEPLERGDLPLLLDWLCRPHVRDWWPPPASLSEVEEHFDPMLESESTARGYIASIGAERLGFIQSYVVKGAGDGWWENETDPGARGIDQFLANAEHLGRGLGSVMAKAFVARLFRDPAVTKVQADPSPDNERAIRCYKRAGFHAQGVVDTPDGPALLMVCPRVP